MKLYYATSNQTKFSYAKYYLEKQLPITLLQYDKESPELQIPDQVKIAQHKAFSAFQILNHPVIADDAGLYLKGYEAFPGFMTRYVYQQIGLEGLGNLANSTREASMKVFIAYCDKEGVELAAIGSKKGTLLLPPPLELSNEHRAPFEYCFLPLNSPQPLGFLKPEEKNVNNSFRIQGLALFAEWFRRKCA